MTSTTLPKHFDSGALLNPLGPESVPSRPNLKHMLADCKLQMSILMQQATDQHLDARENKIKAKIGMNVCIFQ